MLASMPAVFCCCQYNNSSLPFSLLTVYLRSTACDAAAKRTLVHTTNAAQVRRRKEDAVRKKEEADEQKVASRKQTLREYYLIKGLQRGDKKAGIPPMGAKGVARMLKNDAAKGKGAGRCPSLSTVKRYFKSESPPLARGRPLSLDAEAFRQEALDAALDANIKKRSLTRGQLAFLALKASFKERRRKNAVNDKRRKGAMRFRPVCNRTLTRHVNRLSVRGRDRKRLTFGTKGQRKDDSHAASETNVATAVQQAAVCTTALTKHDGTHISAACKWGTDFTSYRCNRQKPTTTRENDVAKHSDYPKNTAISVTGALTVPRAYPANFYFPFCGPAAAPPIIVLQLAAVKDPFVVSIPGLNQAGDMDKCGQVIVTNKSGHMQKRFNFVMRTIASEIIRRSAMDSSGASSTVCLQFDGQHEQLKAAHALNIAALCASGSAPAAAAAPAAPSDAPAPASAPAKKPWIDVRVSLCPHTR